MTEAAMTAAREIADKFPEIGIGDGDIMGAAAIIAKHFPSPVAAEGDVERVARACPFCGSQPDSYSQAPNSRIWAVKCNVCPVMCYATGDTEEQAIALWNSRYIPFDYMPTYDEALRFIKSNPKTARAALSAQPASVGGGVPEGLSAQVDNVRVGAHKLIDIINSRSALLSLMTTDNIDVIRNLWNAICELEQYQALASPTAIEPQAGWRDGIEAAEQAVIAAKNESDARTNTMKLPFDAAGKEEIYRGNGLGEAIAIIRALKREVK